MQLWHAGDGARSPTRRFLGSICRLGCGIPTELWGAVWAWVNHAVGLWIVRQGCFHLCCAYYLISFMVDAERKTCSAAGRRDVTGKCAHPGGM